MMFDQLTSGQKDSVLKINLG